MKYTLKALHITADMIFSDDSSIQDQVEKMENDKLMEIEKILFNPEYIAIEYFTEYNQRRILHKSTRKGVLYQLSYIDNDGIPAMHENFIETSKEHDNYYIGSKRELLRHYLNISNDSDIELNIYRKEDISA